MFVNIGKFVRPIFKQVLTASFFLSHILIPIGVLLFYFVSISLVLPDGVNKVFMTRSAKYLLPITIFLFIGFFFVIGIRRIKPQFINTSKEELFAGDLLLPFLPLTPVVQYIINNSDILSWFNYILIFCFFV